MVDLQTETSNFIFLLYSNEGDREFGLLNKEVLKKVAKLEKDLQEDE